MNFLARLKRSEDGLATVEMAIVLPVFLLILFGIMEGGLLLFTQHQMDRASREAARYCSLFTTQQTNCTTANTTTIIDQNLTSTFLTSKVISPPSFVADSPTPGVTTVNITISGTFAPLTRACRSR